MQPRFLGRLGLADAITVVNATLGFAAAALATVDVGLAARLVLLAAVADGLDGVVARVRGSTAVGSFLDSLADVASFSVAPAMLVYAVALDAWGLSPTPRGVATVAVPALFVAMGVTRLGLYTAYDTAEAVTEGVQTTLAATVLAAAVLARVDVYVPDASLAALLVGATAVLCYLMVAPITYPELYETDALLLGVVQVLAILFPTALNRTFPWAILVSALVYLLFGPVFYWGRSDADRNDAGATAEAASGAAAGTEGATDAETDPRGSEADAGAETDEPAP